MTDYEKWMQLCTEHEAAMREQFAALGAVTREMTPSGSGDPSERQLDELDLARANVRDVRERMDAFIAERFGR